MLNLKRLNDKLNGRNFVPGTSEWLQFIIDDTVPNSGIDIEHISRISARTTIRKEMLFNNISNAVNWVETPQGYNFWSTLYKKTIKRCERELEEYKEKQKG